MHPSFSKLRALSHEELFLLLRANPQPLLVKNARGELLYANEAWQNTVGRAAAGPGKMPLEAPDHGKAPSEQEQAAFDRGEEILREEVLYLPGFDAPRRIATSLRPVFNEQGQPAFIVGSSRDITEQHQLGQQNDAERKLLESLAANMPLQAIMSDFIVRYEAIFAGTMAAVMLLDARRLHLRHGAAPSLPPHYCAAIDGVAIGAGVGSCGAAAFEARDVVVADIAEDPLWIDYKELALAHSLRACWSIPIRSTKGKVLGTFAVYHSQPHIPSEAELQAARRSAYLLSLAIENDYADAQIEADRLALAEAAGYRQAILDSMVDGLVTVDRAGRIHSHNKAALRMMGLPPNAYPLTLAELLGTALPLDDQGQLELLNRVDGIEGAHTELDGHHLSGVLRPISVSASRIPHLQEETFVVTLRDVTQQRRDEEEIRRLAFYDPLTSLPNRRLLMDRMRQAMINSARISQHGALMFLDLDHFKLLNDTMGHDVGDELLLQVAQRLRHCVREVDTVARLGGDEFVVLLEGLSTGRADAATQAEIVAHKILDALDQPYSLRGKSHASTPSIGIVLFHKDDETIDELLKKADVAMYQAKACGRNTARFFDPVMQAAVTTHAELAEEIRRGLKQLEFVLYFQPQMDSQGQCTGAEALVRWQHPTRGLVSPAEFIPLAEETGTIIRLGDWVLESACHQLVAWSGSPHTAQWTLAINVSAAQLAKPGFVSSVRKALQRTGAAANRLKLEITESMLVDDVEDIIVKMNALKALGVSFSLDDFGTGYSSLSYLKRLPLSQLKIDRSFVQDLLTDPNDAVIARTIVALGHNLGLSVIAEGVETAEQRDLLAGMDCDAFQGYFYSRPVPIDAFVSAAAQEPGRLG
ncbi:EAL domain-containing protein [Rhodoferax sp. OV413]|uniref:sensor domain-containing protein n=1 Tax=Rhodoferax sp. OV413 TaxID=1855285 RepID=UPI0025FA49E3|nr:EAL domain-containing protein [Rhodoferax sp. OV413]